MAAPAQSLLEVTGLTKRFAGLVAVDSVNLRVGRGEVVGLIGPNGAGKTTLINCLSGVDRPSSGRVLFDGAEITDWPAHRRAGRGLVRTFQLLRLFDSLTVLENVMVGLDRSLGYGPFAPLLRGRRFRAAERDARERSMRALDRFGLVQFADATPSTLTMGHKRIVELARAYVNEPSLMFLDEPTSGLNTDEAAEIFELIGGCRDEGIAVVLVEHRIRTVTEVADRLTVLEQGVVVAEGDTEQVVRSDSVLGAYLGSAARTGGPE